MNGNQGRGHTLIDREQSSQDAFQPELSTSTTRSAARRLCACGASQFASYPVLLSNPLASSTCRVPDRKAVHAAHHPRVHHLVALRRRDHHQMADAAHRHRRTPPHQARQIENDPADPADSPLAWTSAADSRFQLAITMIYVLFFFCLPITFLPQQFSCSTVNKYMYVAE